jgi:outer membrane protein TolC
MTLAWSSQTARIAELEAEVRRLRTALQVLTGRPVPEPEATSSPESEEE